MSGGVKAPEGALPILAATQVDHQRGSDCSHQDCEGVEVDANFHFPPPGTLLLKEQSHRRETNSAFAKKMETPSMVWRQSEDFWNWFTLSLRVFGADALYALEPQCLVGGGAPQFG